MKKLLFSLTILLIGCSISAQTDSTGYEKGLEAITHAAVKGQLDFLASDWTEGRGTGMRGEFIASDYIASIFSIYGLEPGGDTKWHYPSWEDRRNGAAPYQYRTYFQEITMLKYKLGKDQSFRLRSDGREISFAYLTDFSVRAVSIACEAESELIFVGYGYVNEDEKYDDYKGLDVKGKIIVRLSGYPGHNDTSSDAYRKFHPEGRYAEYYLGMEKNDIAEEKGVLAIIDISPGYDRSSNWTVNTPFRYQNDYYEGNEKQKTINEYSHRLPGDSLNIGPVRISLSKRAAHEVLRGTGINVEQWEEQLTEKMKPDSKVLSGKSAFISTSVESELITARNVIAVIPGRDTTEAIVLGGHYDHLGMFDGYIWNGADDNASGTVGVMTVAKACMATGEKPERTIVFAAWTGEERGLLGSRYFVNHPYLPVGDIKFHLNYDMISRDSKDDSLGIECTMSYTAGYPFLEENTTQFLEQYDINLDITMRPTMSKGGGSDHSSFARKDIPFFYFMAGWHDEYHTPMDEVDKVNYQKMADIIRVGFLNIWTMANMEELQ
ncbi:MAG: hypothetical protein DRI83_04215 [Bacteroidetes bacterium]|nr:MAG: hypothetical protein DRI83_04215 [Bacteroidota bacterium]